MKIFLKKQGIYNGLILLMGFIFMISCESEETKQEIPKVTSINIVTNYDELNVNDEVTLQAEVLDQFGKAMDKSVNWSVTEKGELTVNFSLSTKLKALSEGTIEVTAELDGVSRVKTIEVIPGEASIYDYLIPSQLENPKIVFTWLVLIYEKVDIPANTERGHPRIQCSMSQNEVKDLVEFMKGFEAFTAEYTGGEIGFNFAVVTLDDRFPLSDLYWDNNRKSYEWIESNDLTREMDTYIGNQTGWFDNIHVFFKMDGDYKPHAMYGGGGYMRDNITRSQYTLMGLGKNDWHVGTWHESIHGLELQYWGDGKRSGSCKRGAAPDGTDIELHGQPAFGYMGNDDNGGSKTQNYFQWMADLTTGNIRNLNSVGWQNYSSAPNTNLGFGRNGMYNWGPVRNEYEFKPGGPFPQD